jgi:hypothetical protein
MLPLRPYPHRAGNVWTVEFRHLGWDMSHRGVVYKALGAQALSGLKAYRRLPHDEVGSKRWLKPDLRIDLACGVPWSVHLKVTDT